MFVNFPPYNCCQGLAFCLSVRNPLQTHFSNHKQTDCHSARQDGNYKEAFSAFKEAVRYKRDSWQTWSNYAAAAVQTDSFQAAARAVEQVVQHQKEKP